MALDPPLSPRPGDTPAAPTGWVPGPRRPARHPLARRPPWAGLVRRWRRRSGRWWLSVVVATVAGAVLGASTTRAAPPADPPAAGAAATPTGLEVPEGRVALAVPRGTPPLPVIRGDRLVLLATDLATGRADTVAPEVEVLAVDDEAVTVAVARDDAPPTAAAATQGLLVAALLPPDP